ncbi:ABC transporter ATP-binding protein [Candidatus Protochlamydia naegleriophila]|uniref:ABC transporter ATP-binding protein n=1 Tax=Candidatus Protochlamydia naegleriophila TaxID=389348 RepID=A0A0U5JB32_9BACT|nr:ABC transporter ATP-binding protein [Candidatus Protochlamydia naegleriophila]CUI15890.1 ABC transporter ATP-binding protein [Candidatus Protochlamydia naegleriophila]
MTSKDLLSFVWKFLRMQPWSFFFIYFLSLSWAIDSTVWPYLLRLIIDTLTQYDMDRLSAWDSLKGLLAAGVCLWIFVECCFRSRDFLRAKAFPKLEADIRMAMFDHIQHHSPKYFNEHFAGSLSNKIADMTSQVTSMLHNAMIFIPALAASILILIFFSAVSPIFALILAIWIVAHFAICFFFSAKCVRYSNDHGEARSQLAGKIVDSFTNNFAVNLFSRFKFERQRIASSQSVEQEKNFRAQYCVALMLMSLSLLFLVGIITLNGLLIFYWIQDRISTGEVIQVFNTTFNVVMILWIAGDLLPQFFKSFGIASQALAVMHDPKDVVDPVGVPPLEVKKGEIIFENVTFQYGQKKLFENKDVHIKGGEKVGLVGYSGAGKSTFVNLILRFYPITRGKILIDGQDIAQVTLDSLRKQVALIPQDPLLFHRTLEENIQYGNIQASQEEVIEAAKLAHCDEFIRKCQNGYASLVGERGTKLSGGERQRIAIARAILAASPILILDEATSSLDSVTETFIQESLEKLMENRTTLVIAHRLSTLAKMDRILVFNQGKIVEEGTHSELVAKQGFYARMWDMQAGGFLPDLPNP